MKYKVRGTIQYNWEATVEADTEDEAERIGQLRADDGAVELSGPYDTPEVDSVEALSDETTSA